MTKHSSSAILPGARLGVLGGGQLGRMFASAAKRMGYRVHVLSPEANGPAAQFADDVTVAGYEDVDAVSRFASAVDVVTFEFENVSAELASAAERLVPVRPAGRVLYTTQNRVREKTFLRDSGFPCTAFSVVDTRAALDEAVERIGLPAVLKSAASGYDGHGQAPIRSPEDVDAAWAIVGRTASVLEAFVDFECEFSVIVARALDGHLSVYPPMLNHHEAHVLDVTVLGAEELARVATPAQELATSIAESLDVVGLICIEFFLAKSGEILVNEVAPRPHNSGHVTIEASVTSQFEQQVRAICGLPLGSTQTVSPAAMANLLGDLWALREPNWQALLQLGDVELHLYGKDEPRPRRKMGHVSALGASPREAEARVRRARERLGET